MMPLGIVASQGLSYEDSSRILHLDVARPESWPGSGTLWKDLSGNQLDLTMNNLIVAAPNGVPAMTFNGAPGNCWAYRASDPRLDLTGPSTACAWINPTDNREGAIFNKGWGVGGWMWWYYANDIRDYIQGNTKSYFNGIPVQAWTHVAFTHDGTGVRCYINGTNVGSYVPAILPLNNNEPFALGQYGGVQYFYGYMNGLRLNSRALSAAEIASIFAAERAQYKV